MSEVKNFSIREAFEWGKNEGSKFIFVEIELDNHPAPQLIIDPIENADLRADYLESTYDENFKHKFMDGIQIVSYGCVSELAELYYGEDEETWLA